MIYVIIILLIISIGVGLIAGRRDRAAKQRNSGCGSGCGDCAYNYMCENNEKK